MNWDQDRADRMLANYGATHFRLQRDGTLLACNETQMTYCGHMQDATITEGATPADVAANLAIAKAKAGAPA
jgi:hypothetical protein